ncbi:MAG: hypothetical protein JWN57_449 [Frankiales bacterium]|nr:hypothetical protein [Frankiales bacterium]
MPTGAYLLSDHDGPYAVERFTCAPGPAGWRYTATRSDPGTGAPLGRLDLTLDGAGRAVRLELAAGGWELRGGMAGASAVWRRGEAERTATAAGFTGTSPAFAVATARLLGLSVGDPRRVRLVRVGDEALAARTVEEGWARTVVTDSGGLPVERYEAADLATGERRVLHLVGDVVVDGTGIALLELQTPPTLTRP